MEKRLNTRLESEGAEFLVLGQLLIHKIPSYKTYTNMPGYDIVSTNPDANTSCKIQVKSRWRTGASQFPIRNFDCDFVVVTFLNRGSKHHTKEVLPPEYFVIPANIIQKISREAGKSGANVRDIPDLERYRENWNLISEFLGLNR